MTIKPRSNNSTTQTAPPSPLLHAIFVGQPKTITDERGANMLVEVVPGWHLAPETTTDRAALDDRAAGG